MVRPIMKDEAFLKQPSEPAVEADMPVARDLLDTLKANASHCVGMAANMIGEAKRIIAVDDEGGYLLMFNPEIIERSGPYEAEEGCLSLTGTRKTIRYKKITVRYQNRVFRERERTFRDWTAQIVQHEIDHCNGVII